MGMSVDSGSGGYEAAPNVVPMIDILLVLLIIFMMQVSMSRKAMDVQLPPIQEQQQQDQTESSASNQIVLELLEDGTYAINSQPVPLSGLDARIHEIFDPRPSKLMFVKTAGNRPYQDVVQAMDIARGAGVQVIGFTPPEAK